MSRPKISISRLGIQKKSSFGQKILTFIKYTIVFIIVVVAFFGGFVFVEKFIRDNYLIISETNVVTWTSSLASYWGGILGGAVSGIIALGGTFIVINYYRKSDLENKRIESQPFLNIVIQKQQAQQYNQKPIFELGKGSKSQYIEISVKNIGKGFAQTLVYYDGSNIGGNQFRYTIESGMALDVSYNIKLKYTENEQTHLNFGIMFMDCFANEYIQTFDLSIDSSNKSASVSCNYPQLTLPAFK